MVSIEELKVKAKKNTWSKVNYMWHILGLYVAKPLLKTNITPNQITILWILLEFISAFLMLGTYTQRVIGIIIFNFLVTLLDFTDGNIARAKNIKSFTGIYLEYLGLFFGMPLLFLALGFKVYFMTNNISAIFLGGICCITMLYEKLFNINPGWFEKEKWDKLGKIYMSQSINQKSIFAYLAELFRKGQPFNVLFFGVIFDYLSLTLIIYAVVSSLAMLRKLISQYLSLKKIDNDT